MRRRLEKQPIAGTEQHRAVRDGITLMHAGILLSTYALIYAVTSLAGMALTGRLDRKTVLVARLPSYHQTVRTTQSVCDKTDGRFHNVVRCNDASMS